MMSTFGTNGFYLEFKQTGTSGYNSSGIGVDTSIMIIIYQNV